MPLILESGSSEDMVMGNMSIVVQKATPEDAGDYTCTAHNSEGSSRSNPVKLRINHGPTCKRSTPLVLGVPRHHSLNVTCQVSSFPPPSGFSWALHTYLGRLQVPQDRINWQGTTSWITYTPRATEDYGELICWAHTHRGLRQQVPCVARLVPADTPDAPERCRVSRRTPSSLTVSCIAAHDGGLPQTFHAWVSAGRAWWMVGGGRSCSPCCLLAECLCC
uniref:Immunoglobulin-like beta-sandwich domain-containing protein n=1 Tax=Scylla olivacea TaxID=85551 RepID=A0A0P4W7B2_SCYOL